MTVPALLQPTLHRFGATATGILLMVVAILSFTILDSAANALVDRYHVLQVLWARIGLQLLFVVLILRGRLPALARSRYPWLHTARAVTQVAAGGFFFASLMYIGFAETAALADMSPILITLGAALFLGERLGLHRVIGVLAAMAGAMFIIRPGSDVFTPAALLPLGCAGAYAANALLTRALGSREDAWTAMIWTSAIGTALVSVAMPWVWQPVAAADAPLYLLMGVCGTFSQICVIRAFSLAEASAIAPFTYLGILFATLWGILFFGEIPTLSTIAGAAVIVASGLYVWYCETRPGPTA